MFSTSRWFFICSVKANKKETDMQIQRIRFSLDCRDFQLLIIHSGKSQKLQRWNIMQLKYKCQGFLNVHSQHSGLALNAKHSFITVKGSCHFFAKNSNSKMDEGFF